MGKNSAPVSGEVAALVLMDFPSHGLKAGDIFEADGPVIEQLKASGTVDSHKDAVAYAKSNSARVVNSKAQAEAAELAALIADVEAQLAVAADADKPALQGQLDALRTA